VGRLALQFWPISIDETIPSFDVAWYRFGGDTLECHVELDQPSARAYRAWIVAVPINGKGELVHGNGLLEPGAQTGVVQFPCSDWSAPAGSKPLGTVRWLCFVTTAERRATAWGAMHGRFMFSDLRDRILLSGVLRYILGGMVLLRCAASIALSIILVVLIYHGVRWFLFSTRSENIFVSLTFKRLL
jgi:hypothetical protein